ncbi:DNA polymerase lambda [Psilocybe cubensis]|uniref:DNA polymerase lambda n=1 Tax=Psilocybe cubensis TaxID=181762 RepID=A0ACB8GMN6_PSICU|nr:DNA polymerase lambda [Psilocybe cubensis]KAH9476829.1 DNA polymerase lambda [Psilocybe cubensis]
MSEFNIKQYYAEQDEHMNLKEETLEEYSTRTTSSRRRAESDKTNAILGAAPPAAPLLPSHDIASAPEHRRTSEKRKASFLEPVVQKDKVIDSDKIRAITSDTTGLNKMPLAPSQTSFATPQRSGDPKAQKPSSPSLEDIDSFTVDFGNEIMFLSSANVERRDLIPIDVPPTVQKKRRVDGIRSPQIPDTCSPISSFSVSAVHSPQKVRSAPKDDSGPSVLRQVVPLHLVSQAVEIEAKSNKVPSDPPTSPIEDPSMVIEISSSNDPVAIKPLKNAPSKMLLDIQERIAAKQAGKGLDKVLKISSNSEMAKAKSSKPISSYTVKEALEQPITKTASSEQKGKQSHLFNPLKKITQAKKPATAKKVRELMSGAQCAEKVLSDLASNTIKLRKLRPLEGTNILFVGADALHATRDTEEKMTQIVRYGGNLMPNYNPDTTSHIVSAENNTRNVLKATGAPNVKAIPERIPIVTWKWVEALMNSRSPDDIAEKLRETWKYQSFQSRVVLTPITSLKTYKEFKRKQQSKATTIGYGGSDCEVAVPSTSSIPPVPNVGQDVPSATASVNDDQPHVTNRQVGALLSPPSSPRIHNIGVSKVPTSSAVLCSDPNDPLAEFYGRPREQKEIEEKLTSGDDINMIEQRGGDETDESEPEDGRPLPRSKRGWTCDTMRPKTSSQCPNQDIIDKLEELMKIHDSKVGSDQAWRVRALSKAIGALRSHPHRVRGYSDAKRIPGIGEKSAMKIDEIIKTGALRRIVYENSEDVQVTSLFTGIYGVGQTIALRWYAAGCRTLEDLKVGKGGVKLSSIQKIGLQFYDDINERMPRTETKHIYDLIRPIGDIHIYGDVVKLLTKPAALSIDSILFVELMGSYRRGKTTCGDIDILITRPTDDGLTHRGVLSRLIQELHKHGIITEDLALPDNPYDLEATYRGLCRLPGLKDAKRRRIDILTVPWKSRGAALLYYTFNRAMRLKANHMGYSLNQRGLFGGVVRDPSDRRKKLDDGKLSKILLTIRSDFYIRTNSCLRN